MERRTALRALTRLSLLALFLTAASPALAQTPPTIEALEAALQSARSANKVLMVELIESDSPESIALVNDVLNTAEFQAWASRKVVTTVMDLRRDRQKTPEARNLANKAWERFELAPPPRLIFIDREGRELGQLCKVQGGVKAWTDIGDSILASQPGFPRISPERSATAGQSLCCGLTVVGALVLVVALVVGGKLQNNEAAAVAVKSVGAASARPQRTLVDDLTFGDEKTRALKTSLAAGRWETAHQLLDAERDPSRREFLVEALSDWEGKAAFATRAELIPAWVAAAPTSATPHLLLGKWLITHAWDARGGGVASTVSDGGRRLFQERLLLSEEALMRAAQLDPKASLPWAYRVITDRGLGRKLTEGRKHFEEAVAREPECRAAHWALLAMLCQKWMGSHDQMFAFAREATAKARPGSRLPALIGLAHAERWLYVTMADANEAEPFRGIRETYWKQSSVRTEIVAAYDRSVGSPGFVESSPAGALERNVFAFCFYMLGEKERLRIELEKIGTRAVEIPWRWAGETSFDDARKLVGLPPRPARGAR